MKIDITQQQMFDMLLELKRKVPSYYIPVLFYELISFFRSERIKSGFSPVGLRRRITLWEVAYEIKNNPSAYPILLNRLNQICNQTRNTMAC